jgi:hypothetical protein
MNNKFRLFATCDIGDAIDVLRQRGYEVEVYPDPKAPPKELIVDKVKSGIDGLITTLRDPIDAEVFEAGKGKLKVVAQIAVGFDNINRADANRYKVPFTHTADVLTEATAEFAFFMMGALARKMWTAEHLTRDLQWGYWHPYLPFLGDEVTGKTVAVIGTGRIGLAFIKKCMGFDMNVLCYDPAYENHAFVESIQQINDLRHERGLTKEKTWIKYVSFPDALRDADFVSVPADEADRLPGEYIEWARGGRIGTGPRLARELDCGRCARRVRERAPSGRFPFARSRHCRPLPPHATLRQRCAHHSAFHRSGERNGRQVRAGSHRRP